MTLLFLHAFGYSKCGKSKVVTKSQMSTHHLILILGLVLFDFVLHTTWISLKPRGRKLILKA